MHTLIAIDSSFSQQLFMINRHPIHLKKALLECLLFNQNTAAANETCNAAAWEEYWASHTGPIATGSNSMVIAFSLSQVVSKFGQVYCQETDCVKCQPVMSHKFWDIDLRKYVFLMDSAQESSRRGSYSGHGKHARAFLGKLRIDFSRPC